MPLAYLKELIGQPSWACTTPLTFSPNNKLTLKCKSTMPTNSPQEIVHMKELKKSEMQEYYFEREVPVFFVIFLSKCKNTMSFLLKLIQDENKAYKQSGLRCQEKMLNMIIFKQVQR